MPFLIRVPAVVVRRLCLLTLFYLALPLLIFFLGWLRPFCGIPASLLLLGTLGILTRRGWNVLPGEATPARDEWSALTKALLWTWVPIALMTLQVGVGGFGMGTYDWDNKHNLIFADLVRFSWPVIYHGEGTPSSGLMLVYYSAYYLPAAAVGKLLGWNAANVAWQLWTQLGMLLVCGWLVAFAGTRVRWLGFLFLVFSGAALLGFLVHNFDATLRLSPASGARLMNFDAIHRWNTTVSYYVLYGSNILQLFWAPQHLLTGWLGISLLLNRWNAERIPEKNGASWDGGWGGSALFGWGMLVFWSPLAALGCLPFLLAVGAREIRNSAREKDKKRDISTLKLTMSIVLTSAICALVVALYLAVRTPPPPDAAPQRGEHLEFLLAPLLHIEGWHALWRYGTFVLVEFGLLYALIWPRRNDRELRIWRAPLGVGLFVLLLLPCFIYGFYNDLSLRASIPSLAILFFSTTIFLQSSFVSRARRAGVFVLLLCGTVVFLTYSRTVGHTLLHGQWNSRRPLAAFPTIIAEYSNDPRHLLSQYTGPTNSPFARFLAK
ncbi:hypothetical protein IAD21_03638 [Abditibacteriota bacterium]|nr:hypothetical protein IAD21_03638 [Abditibacteriota bacterium]